MPGLCFFSSRNRVDRDLSIAGPDLMDAMVICGAVELAPGRNDVVTNPVVLVEILSPATRAYDLGEKFDLYKAIPTCREYLVLEQDRCCARLFVRRQEQWTAETFDVLDGEIDLSSLTTTLRLTDVRQGL